MRYYANKCGSEGSATDADALARFPEIDECVVVQVRQIQEMGAYVSLHVYEMALSESRA